jgi:hypothetical protein
MLPVLFTTSGRRTGTTHNIKTYFLEYMVHFGQYCYIGTFALLLKAQNVYCFKNIPANICAHPMAWKIWQISCRYTSFIWNVFSKVDILTEFIWLSAVWQLCKHWVCTWYVPKVNQAELILKISFVTNVLVSAGKMCCLLNYLFNDDISAADVSARQNINLIT